MVIPGKSQLASSLHALAPLTLKTSTAVFPLVTLGGGGGGGGGGAREGDWGRRAGSRCLELEL